MGLGPNSRVLVFALPFWGHLSTCLALADAMAHQGSQFVFAFVYPPPQWVAREITGHGHECHWSLQHVRSALGHPDRLEQWRAVVGAQTDIIRETGPDVVLNDIDSTTPAAARTCGVPVVSITRCPFPEPWFKEMGGDVQLVPHSQAWLPVPASGAVYCRPAWAQRMGVVSTPVDPQPVLAALCTADAQPAQLRLMLDAFEQLDAGWLVCYSHPDEAAAGSRHVVAWTDHSILAGSRVLVCHGGHGLIGRAIMYGVPVVVLETEEPHTPIYGSALEAAGAGILLRRRDQTPLAIREATVRAMSDSALRDGVAALRRAFEALPDIADALPAALRVWSRAS
jgi:UDP:flavonoid glycosyltransferase YjiC (YdhE family)